MRIYSNWWLEEPPWKIWKSDWIIIPTIGEHKKWIKMVQNTDQILMWIMWMYLKRSDTTKIIDHFTRGNEINGIQPTLNYDPCKNLAGSSINSRWLEKAHFYGLIFSKSPWKKFNWSNSWKILVLFSCPKPQFPNLVEDFPGFIKSRGNQLLRRTQNPKWTIKHTPIPIILVGKWVSR